MYVLCQTIYRRHAIFIHILIPELSTSSTRLIPNSFYYYRLGWFFVKYINKNSCSIVRLISLIQIFMLRSWILIVLNTRNAEREAWVLKWNFIQEKKLISPTKEKRMDTNIDDSATLEKNALSSSDTFSLRGTLTRSKLGVIIIITSTWYTKLHDGR